MEKEEVDEELLSSIQSTKLYSLQELLQATDNFSLSNKIGTGGFGSTYKGVLKDGTVIAVKQTKEFSSMLMSTKATSHEHFSLVHLPVVVPVASISLGKYAVEFALVLLRGLAFLHDANILHRDISARNVLLNDEFNPQISGFGNATYFHPDLSYVSKRVVGKLGYLAPEYTMHGWLTKKADSYSFGVLILEIVSGRNSTEVTDEGNCLLDRAWDLHERKELLGLVDIPVVRYLDREDAYKYLIICLLCTQHDPDLRPDISTVLGMLTGKINVSRENLSRPDFFRADEGEISGKLV
ncbi:cold-responsive protein kinase 1-like [Punica granatum]|uniref:Cold-responsive protein kinase 1-like n=1 Tax=Punica granatum TaxID=22663 RepID=A0A218XIW4_PUNGR|nr:cold-responsive protein kinase 1-like [Punica granatum]OWM84854.1 hypothetical protein CDL15_Pgr027641 [Punica granatum]